MLLGLDALVDAQVVEEEIQESIDLLFLPDVDVEDILLEVGLLGGRLLRLLLLPLVYVVLQNLALVGGRLHR